MAGIKPATWKIASILSIGMMAIATAAILIRSATASVGTASLGFSFVIAASRMTLATLILIPQLFMRQQPIPWQNRRAIGYTVLAGMALAIHFAVWVTSLTYTSITASTVLVTTTPIWTGIACYVLFQEPITRTLLIGMTISIGGGIIIALHPISTTSGSQPLLGNCLALAGAIMATAYLLLGRAAQNHGLQTRQYILVAYGTAALLLLPLPGLMGTSYWGYSPITYLWLTLLAIVPQLIGHTSFNWAIQHLSPSLVTLAIMAEPIGASILGYLIFSEAPTARTLLGSGMILSGIAIVSLNQRSSEAA